MSEVYMWDLSQEDSERFKLHHSDNTAKSVEEEEGLDDPRIIFFEVDEDW